MKEQNFTEGTPWKQILLFAIPIFLGNILQQLYNTVDTIVVGNYESQLALNAVGTTACLTMFFITLANGFSTGAGVLVAQNYGANRMDAVRRYAGTALLLLLGMGVISVVAGVFLCAPVLRYVLAVPDSFYTSAVLYFQLYSLGLAFQFCYCVIAAILRALGDSRATLYFLLIASVLNIALDLLLVAGLHWGVAGAAIATDISQFFSCLAAIIYMYRKYPVFRWKRGELRFESKLAAEILRTGLPMAMHQLVVSMGFIFLQRAINSYGDAMIASFTVEQRIENYLWQPTTAVMITMANYTGQNVGAGKLDRVTHGARQALILSELTTAAVSVLVFLFARQIIALFAIDAAATFYCVTHLRVASVILLTFAGFYPLLGLFQGAKQGHVGMITASVSLGIRVVTVYTLCYLPLFGYTIIWWSVLFGWLVAGAATWIYYLSGRWKRNLALEV